MYCLYHVFQDVTYTEDDLLTILTQVCGKMAINMVTYCPSTPRFDKAKSAACVYHRLSKDIYLQPNWERERKRDWFCKIYIIFIGLWITCTSKGKFLLLFSHFVIFLLLFSFYFLKRFVQLIVSKEWIDMKMLLFCNFIFKKKIKISTTKDEFSISLLWFFRL